MQSDGANTYTFDGLDRMTGAGSNTYQYDALDRQRTSNGNQVHYDGFSQSPVIETVGGSDRVYALDPFGRPKALQNGANSEFLTDDGHGNIGAVTNATQGVSCATQYDPWGKPANPGQTTPCTGAGITTGDIFYRAFRRDAATGDYQFGSRTYDPTKAGFLSSDVYRTGSSGMTQGLQLDPMTMDRYNYVNGDPVNLVDFDGHKVCAEGDPNPDCDAYRPGTTYKGWKDQAYYDRQEQQRAHAEQEAQVRYAKWEEQQKREAEKKKHDCRWDPTTWGSCAGKAANAIYGGYRAVETAGAVALKAVETWGSEKVDEGKQILAAAWEDVSKLAGDTWRNITEFRPIRAIISEAKTVGRLITAGIDDIPRALGKISVGKVAETVGKWAGRVLIVPGAVIAGWEDYFQNPGNRSGLDRLGHAFAVGIGTGVGSLAGDAAAVLGCGETGPGAIVCAAVLPTLGAVGGGIVGGAIYDAIEKEINNPAPVTPTFPPFRSPTWPWPSRNWPFQWTF